VILLGSGCVPVDTSQVDRLYTEDVYNDGSMLKFQCTGNYHLMGAKEIYCNTRDWSDVLPRCAGKLFILDCVYDVSMLIARLRGV